MEYAKVRSDEVFEDRGVCRQNHADDVGFGFEEHSHPWSHTVTCTKGSLKVVVDGVETILTPDSAEFTMPGNSNHSVEILENGTEFYTEHPIDLSQYSVHDFVPEITA